MMTCSTPKTFFSIASLMSVVLFASFAKADALNLAVVDEVIIPGYKQLADSSKSLVTETKAFCSAENPSDNAALKVAYEKAFLDWQGVQFVRFGPIQILMRDFRFEYWPDKKSKTAKHLSTLLAADDFGAQIAPENFASASIAVQGFGAFEWLLYGLKSEEAKEAQARKCVVMQSIADNLAQMAQGMLNEWSGGDDAFRQYINTGDEENLYFENSTDVSSQILNAVHVELTLVESQKLGLPIEGKRANPKRAEAWRAGLSLPAIRQNVETAHKVYEIGFKPRVEDDALKTELDQAFSRLIETLNGTDNTLLTRARDEAAQVEVASIKAQVAALNALIASKLTEATGIPLAFNSMDGD